MDRKKLFAIAIVVFAVFCCLSVASAGLFDFLGGPAAPANKTVTFDKVFSLQLPEDAVIKNNTTINDGTILEITHDITSNATNTTYRVTTTNGTLVSGAQEYAEKIVASSGKALGNHSGWIELDTSSVPDPITPMKYILTKSDGGNLITIEGNNLTQVEHLADTYKKV
ncbi:hypothetical protein [Methanobrevibacter sp.]|uniref:hypothetical protein n=1 Tax=Methanobrevibacter sp. TaxID=66852 RepID=UPI00388E5EB9